jgi:integrase
MVRRGEATADILLKSANDALKRLGQDQIKRPSAAEWFASWLKSQKGETSPQIIERYESTIQKFLKSLGPKADLRLSAITTGDVIKFRDELLTTGLSPVTVNRAILKLLKRPFSVAVNTGVIDRSLINKDTVRPLKDATTERKGVFSPEHIVRLIDAAEGDWKGLILAGYYTGQRLMDLSTLQWRAVDLDVQHAVSITQGKTGAFVTIPLHPQLEEYLTNCPSSDDPRSPVFPSLAKKRTSGNTGLSTGFKAIMTKAGIDGGLIRPIFDSQGRFLLGRCSPRAASRAMEVLRPQKCSAIYLP